MFDKLKAAAGLAGVFKDLPRIQARFEEAKRELEQRTVEASSGGGAVTATVNGRMRVVRVDINRAMLTGLVDAGREEDLLLAEDLITGAVNAALTRAQEMITTELAAVAEEFNLPLPPGGVGSLLA